jgi:hypothetical protein
MTAAFITDTLTDATLAIPTWLQSRKLASIALLFLFLYLLMVTALIFWAITGNNPLEIVGIGTTGASTGTAFHLREQGQSDRSANYGGQYGAPPAALTSPSGAVAPGPPRAL